MRRTWSKERVIAAIQERFQQGLPLVGFSREVRSLGYFATKHFGGWHKAVAAAGIPDGWQHKWNQRRVIEALQACAQPGQPFTARQVSASVHGAVYYHFGTWYKALEAAGPVPLCPVPRKQWTKGVVLAEIRARAQQDAPLTVDANPNLAAAARKRFGSWRRALTAAGCSPMPPSRELTNLRRIDSGLQAAGRKHFGSWRKALAAAGLPVSRE
jgi:hypothetical protein